MTSTSKATDTAALPISIRRLQPTSDQDVQISLDFEMAAIEQTFGAREVRTLEQQAAMMASTPYWDIQCYGAFITDESDAEVMAGVLELSMPLNENVEMIHLRIEVLRQFRGRGIGSRLVDELQVLRQQTGRPRK